MKLPKKEPVELAGTLVMIVRGDRVLLWRRPSGAERMAEFWELPDPVQLPGLRQGEVIGTFRHTITHHHFTFRVISGEIPRLPRGFRLVAFSRLREMPLSTTARKAMRLCPDLAKVL